MTIEMINGLFSIFQVEDLNMVNLKEEFTFIGNTDRERSVVQREELVPRNALSVDTGWKMMRISGKLDFSLAGILADISGILKNEGISIFAISTFDTDYILVKEDSTEKAIESLKRFGYEVKNSR